MNLIEQSPQALAYLGDAVFELRVRSMIVSEKEVGPVKELHRKAEAYVSAQSQSRMYFKIYDLLTEEEQSMLRRGRNCKTNSKAKNASVFEYQHATGLETLFGHLYLKGDMKRLDEVFECCISEKAGGAASETRQ
jgi:ribonuclease-3 family protein